MNRILNLLIAIDQLVYVIVTLGVGMPDETMSSAAWRTEQQGRVFGKFFRPIIDFLFAPLQAQHCYQAFLAERRRAQMPNKLKGVDDDRRV